MTKPWYMYSVSVPFGDPRFDSKLGGAHDMDVAPPPNYPVTALLPGKVSSISAPLWGKQVGIQLDTPFHGVPYMGYLHLSATNPALSKGTRVNIGDLIGWVGGANDESQYAGTSNPTGQNFVNPPFQSSQVQVGLALMRGPEYGTAGWETFPPVDWALDPTPIIEAAKEGMTQVNGTYPGVEEHFVPRSYMFDSNAHAAIVIHKTGGDATPEAVLQTFINSASDPDPAKRMRSAHYAVGQDGSIFQFVPEELGAGANGHANPNHADYDRFWDPYVQTYGNLNLCTLSIEHCDPSVNNDTPLTPAQKEASFKLVAYLVQKYAIPVSHIKTHKSISATECPGTYPMGELLQSLIGKTIDLTDPVVAGYFGTTPDGQWQCKQTGFIVQKGILSFYRSYGQDAYCGLTYLGLPLSNEIPTTGHPDVVKQEFERGWVCYDPTHVIDFPPGAGDVYLLHLPG